MENTDYLRLTADEFAALEHWQLQEVLQQFAGHMAVARAEMRENSDGHHKYLAAKEDFTYLKSMATTIQTLLRSN